MVGLVDTLKGFVEWFIDSITEVLATGIDAIARATYWVPHPQLDEPSDLYLRPDSGVWANIYDFHWDYGVPVGVTILIGMWFLRTAGVAGGVLNTESKVRADKNILVGIVMISLSYYIAVLYLNIAHGIAIALAPGKTELEAVALELAGVSGGVAIAFHFLNISLSATLFILLLLVNLIRIIAVYSIPMLAWLFVTLHYAKVPILTPVVTDLGKKVSKTALWTIPVAAGWRVMYVLQSADTGIIESAMGGQLTNVGASGIDTILSTTLFMIPLIIGIASPLLMSNVSQMYYLNRLTGLSLGDDKGGGDGGTPGGGGGGGGAGPGGGDGDATPGTQTTLDQIGNEPTGGGDDSPNITARARSEASSAASLGKMLTPGMSNDQEYIDWDQIESDKEAIGKVGDFAESAGEKAGEFADSISDDPIEKDYDVEFLQDREPQEPVGPDVPEDSGTQSQGTSTGQELIEQGELFSSGSTDSQQGNSGSSSSGDLTVANRNNGQEDNTTGSSDRNSQSPSDIADNEEAHFGRDREEPDNRERDQNPW